MTDPKLYVRRRPPELYNPGFFDQEEQNIEQAFKAMKGNTWPVLTGEDNVVDSTLPYGDIRRFGAVGDGMILSDGAITSGSANLSSLSNPFTRSDKGKTIMVVGAGVGGIPLQTTIASYNSAGLVALSVPASTTVTAAPVVYGTDNLGAINNTFLTQTALALLGYGSVATAPSGRYCTSDYLNMGLGTTFGNLIFKGDGSRYRAGLGFVGTAIMSTFADARMILSMQGLRMPLVEGIWFYNAAGVAYILAQGLGGATPLLDPSVASNWEYAPNLDTTFCPNAGITIDAFAGVKPGTAYPTTGNSYGKNNTIKPRIRGCGFSGFIAGIVCQPSNADTNGDYLDSEDNWFEYGKWGVSVGNSQSRAVNIENCQFSFLYRWITDNQHGKKIGKYGGTITNDAGFDCDGIFELGAATGGPIVFNTCYHESHRVMGNVVQNGSTTEYSYLFNGCDFKFNTQGDTLGVPQYILTGGNSGIFKFTGCTFSVYDSVLGFQPVNCEFDGGCQFRPQSARTNPYEKYAHNALAGGLVAPRLRLGGPARLRSKQFNLDTGVATTAPGMTDKWLYGDRTVCIPFYGNRVVATGAITWDDLPNPHAYQLPAGSTAGVIISKTSGGTTVAFGTGATGKEMTIVFGARTDSIFLLFGPLPGDVIYDDATGTVFFVHSRTALTVLATAQNNYKSDGAGGYQFITAVSTTTGAMYVGNSRLYTPGRPLFGTVAAATAAVTACGPSSGTAAYDTDIVDGDIAMVWTDIDAWTTTVASAILSSHSSAAATITFAAGTGMRAATRRFAYWARQGPANV